VRPPSWAGWGSGIGKEDREGFYVNRRFYTKVLKTKGTRLKIVVLAGESAADH
jgi:hypothetical protein